MKGDFSQWAFDPADNLTGVLSQQGRVFTDPDITAITQIASHWRETLGRDAIGPNVVAVPAQSAAGWRVTAAETDGVTVKVTLEPGRAWVDGAHLSLPGSGPVTLAATYYGPPLQSPPASPATIGAGVRDAVVLEAWEDSVSAYQEPVKLLEPALGGPDTTERSRLFFALRLLRLTAAQDCATVAARLSDDLAARGRLTVTPAPSVVITGDCPLEAGGGYTGLEHFLYRIEVAEPAAGFARFKWSQFNGGLVGRGSFAITGATTGTVTVTANDQAINHCGLPEFYLEALAYDAAAGHWRIAMTADAVLSQPGVLTLTGIEGSWPAAASASAFFRLWNGIARVTDFQLGAPGPLKDGVRLEFDPPAAGNANYRPGDYWTFPVRAAGTPMDPSLWPANAPPQGIRHYRAPLAILDWQADLSAQLAEREIDDCRRVFHPLTQQKTCCSFTVGDGISSHGDFDSIEEALRHLPASGGQLCLLPGLHQANAVIRDRVNVRVVGCDAKTKVVPRRDNPNAPIFHVVDSAGVSLEHMDMIAMGGIAVLVEGARPGTARDITVAWNRIIACVHAVRAVNVARFGVHHNRIRMLDRADGGVAIFASGDDGLIERNDLTVIPAPEMPPIEDPAGGEPVDPADPCARFDILFLNRPLFVSYVNLVWGLVLVLLPTAPYRAPGGIHLAGGCERVRVLENAIRGGAGNGITLGTTPAAPPEGEPAPVEHHLKAINELIAGTVAPPAGVAPGNIQLAFTNVATNQTLSAVTNSEGQFAVRAADGTYRAAVTTPGLGIEEITGVNVGSTRIYTVKLVAVEAPAEPPDFGFLYDIAIEKNRIAGMGLSGIGVPASARAATGAADNRVLALLSYFKLLATPVIGLLIEGNWIHRCLRNPFDAALGAEARVRGLGGVSLGLCQDAVIRENRIEECGTRHVDPVCGIYVAYGECVEVTLNQVRDNGPLRATTDALTPGRRGGIVLEFVTSLQVLEALDGSGDMQARALPAARVHENEVDQPAGLALRVSAMGAIMVSDNAFASEISGPSAAERRAGTVFILNLGGIQFGLAGFKRQSLASSALPGGFTQFCDNQSRTGRRASSRSSHVIYATDDLDYSHNQSRNLQTSRLFANALISGATLRASGNRLSETGESSLSMMSQATRLNATTFNQGDHCIIVVSSDPAHPEVQDGNMVLDNRLCRPFNMIAELLFQVRS